MTVDPLFSSSFVNPSFVEIRLDQNLSRSGGGYIFNTQTSIAASGLENRISHNTVPLFQGDIGNIIVDQCQLEYLIAFFNARKGRAQGFRYKYYADYKCSAQPEFTTDNYTFSQGVTIPREGNGINKEFQIAKLYRNAGEETIKPLFKIVPNTVKAFISDSEIDREITDFGVDLTTGKIYFNQAPPNNANITVECEFDLPVRFDIDEFVGVQEYVDTAGLNQTGKILYTFSSLPIVEFVPIPVFILTPTIKVKEKDIKVIYAALSESNNIDIYVANNNTSDILIDTLPFDINLELFLTNTGIDSSNWIAGIKYQSLSNKNFWVIKTFYGEDVNKNWSIAADQGGRYFHNVIPNVSSVYIGNPNQIASLYWAGSGYWNSLIWSFYYNTNQDRYTQLVYWNAYNSTGLKIYYGEAKFRSDPNKNEIITNINFPILPQRNSEIHLKFLANQELARFPGTFKGDYYIYSGVTSDYESALLLYKDGIENPNSPQIFRYIKNNEIIKTLTPELTRIILNDEFVMNFDQIIYTDKQELRLYQSLPFVLNKDTITDVPITSIIVFPDNTHAFSQGFSIQLKAVTHYNPDRVKNFRFAYYSDGKEDLQERLE